MRPALLRWGRWCLPSFNENCNQLLKGSLADWDNHLCDGKILKKPLKVEKKDVEEHVMTPWENPTAMIFINNYGM